MAYRREIVQHEITQILPDLVTASDLQREYWLRELVDQLTAWPDLEPELRQALSPYPATLQALEKVRSQA